MSRFHLIKYYPASNYVFCKMTFNLISFYIFLVGLPVFVWITSIWCKQKRSSESLFSLFLLLFFHILILHVNVAYSAQFSVLIEINSFTCTGSQVWFRRLEICTVPVISLFVFFGTLFNMWYQPCLIFNHTDDKYFGIHSPFI